MPFRTPSVHLLRLATASLALSSLARVQNWPLSVDFFARVYPAPLGCRFASRTQPLIRTRAPAAFHGKAGEGKIGGVLMKPVPISGV